MKLCHGLVPALLFLGVQQAALAQGEAPPPLGSQVSMCVTTLIGTCGSACEPFQCAPNLTFVSSNERMRFDLYGLTGSVYVLFWGRVPGVPACQPVPGIAGQLAIWMPTPLHIGFFPKPDPKPALTGPFCRPGNDSVPLDVGTISPGYALRFQVLGWDTYRRGTPVLSFSRATEVITR